MHLVTCDVCKGDIIRQIHGGRQVNCLLELGLPFGWCDWVLKCNTHLRWSSVDCLFYWIIAWSRREILPFCIFKRVALLFTKTSSWIYFYNCCCLEVNRRLHHVEQHAMFLVAFGVEVLLCRSVFQLSREKYFDPLVSIVDVVGFVNARSFIWLLHLTTFSTLPTRWELLRVSIYYCIWLCFPRHRLGYSLETHFR